MEDEFALIEAWQQGDRAAGDRLLRRHVPSIRRFFRNKVDAHRDVDDLVQSTLLESVRAKDKFQGRASFRTLLFTVARRQLFRHFERKHRGRVEELGSVTVADLCTSPSQIVARAREQTILLDLLRNLPLDLQMAIELHYWEELTTAELAEILGIPQGTVKSRLRRARETLARAWEQPPQELERVARSIRDVAGS